MTPVEDIFDVVDESDQVVSRASRSEVHSRGLIHRAVHIFVFHPDGRLLLQLRSARKDKHPRTWDTSCCGHVDSGEDYDTAAQREMAEELGLHPCPSLQWLAKSPPCEQTGMEFVGIYRTMCEGPFLPCCDEIDELRWIKPEAMEEEFYSEPGCFAPALPYLWKIYGSMLLGSTTNVTPLI